MGHALCGRASGRLGHSPNVRQEPKRLFSSQNENHCVVWWTSQGPMGFQRLENLFTFLAIVLIVACCGGCGSSGPTISMHPANQTVVVGQTATFSVTARGPAPL